MHKILPAILALIITISLCGCEEKTVGGSEQSPELLSSPSAEISPAPSDAAAESPEITESPGVSPSPITDAEESKRVFRDFLASNYDKLSEVSFGSIAGIGFADLDLDGGLEMILFDAGASVSMGVNIFDIVGGKVVCVSAGMQPIGDAFGGGYLSDISINASFMENFRLMENIKTGERFFIAESGNGNNEASYSEIIRFGNENGALTLSSIFYKYEEYSLETGEVTLQRFRVGNTDAMLSGYTSFVENFEAENLDLELECEGIFVWKINDYIENIENFMTLVDKALELSAQNRMA